MADISKINPNGTEYNLKDEVARTTKAEAIEITITQYEALSTAEKNDPNKIYFITDYPSGSGVVINPTGTATDTAETIEVDGTIYDFAGTDADAVHTADVGVAGGVAELDANGKVPSAQLPTYPTVGNGTLTIQKNGINVQTFTANQSGNSTANITVPEVEETDTTNTIPYLYRASQTTGDRLYDKLVGCSFAVNQLANFSSSGIPSASHGITWSSDDSQSVTLNASSVTSNDERTGWFGLSENSGFKGKENHIILLTSKKISGTISGSTLQLKIYNASYVDVGSSLMVKLPSTLSSSSRLYTKILQGAVLTNYKVTFNAIDLTQMFGTSIADKAYTMERSTAGSGIEWLKSYGFFTKDYYAYDAGSLVSVKPTAHKMVGKNLFDKNGLQSTTYATATIIGERITVTGTYYCKIESNMPSGTYTISYNKISHTVTYGFRLLLSDGSITYMVQTSGVSVTATKDVVAILVYCGTGTSGTTIYENIQIEKGSTATTYEPYTTHTTDISPIDLRGVPKLVNNNIVYDGDVRDESGAITRKYEHLNLGSLNYTYSNNRFVSTTALSPIATSAADTVCGIYHEKFTSWNSFVNYTGGNAMYIDYDNHSLYIKNPSYTDAATFKSAMNGVYLDYKKSTPTTEQITPFANPQICDPNGTEEYVDNREFPIPVGHNTKYIKVPDWMEDGYYKDFRQRVDETIVKKLDEVSQGLTTTDNANYNTALDISAYDATKPIFGYVSVISDLSAGANFYIPFSFMKDVVPAGTHNFMAVQGAFRFMFEFMDSPRSIKMVQAIDANGNDATTNNTIKFYLYRNY